MLNKITCGSCYELLANIGDNSVDMLFCDLPYATKQRKCTANDWDKPMDLPALWAQFNRVCKPNAAMVFTAKMFFAVELIKSNPKNFRYEWIWVKPVHTNFIMAKKQPLLKHELILIFANKQTIYNPIMSISNDNRRKYIKRSKLYDNSNIVRKDSEGGIFCYPNTMLYIGKDKAPIVNGKWGNDGIDRHPTQKPIALLEYLIKTYTNEQGVILDPTAGSCTTAVACIQTNRNFICIEQLEKYCDIGRERIKRASSKLASQLFTPSQIHSQTPLF